MDRVKSKERVADQDEVTTLTWLVDACSVSWKTNDSVSTLDPWHPHLREILAFPEAAYPEEQGVKPPLCCRLCR